MEYFPQRFDDRYPPFCSVWSRKSLVATLLRRQQLQRPAMGITLVRPSAPRAVVSRRPHGRPAHASNNSSQETGLPSLNVNAARRVPSQVAAGTVAKAGAVAAAAEIGPKTRRGSKESDLGAGLPRSSKGKPSLPRHQQLLPLIRVLLLPSSLRSPPGSTLPGEGGAVVDSAVAVAVVATCARRGIGVTLLHPKSSRNLSVANVALFEVNS